MRVALVEIDSVWKFPLLFLAGMSLLLLFRLVLWAYEESKSVRRVVRGGAIVALICSLVWFVADDSRNFLLPYNVAVPFVDMITYFLRPFATTLLINSTWGYHHLPAQANLWSLFLCSVLVVIFIQSAGSTRKELIVLFAVWYAISLTHLNLWDKIPSRKLIYLSPAVCVVFCVAFTSIYTRLTRKEESGIGPKKALLMGLFMLLFLTNIAAIKVEWLRGKLVNTYWTYDYIRLSQVIESDIKHNFPDKVDGSQLYINNVVPVLNTEYAFYRADPDKYSNLKFVLVQRFNDASMLAANVNDDISKKGAGIAYYLIEDKVLNKEGINIDPFSSTLGKARQALRKGDYGESQILLEKALEIRPFLLNYLIFKWDLSDLRWITGGRNLLEWVRSIDSYYRENEKNRRTYLFSLIQKEISDYIECLFFMSYVSHALGKSEESYYWFSQIRFLERNHDSVNSLLTKSNLINSDERIGSFFRNTKEFGLWDEWRNTTLYHYPRFVLKTLLNREGDLKKDRFGKYNL
jgi:hypothetical protein